LRKALVRLVFFLYRKKKEMDRQFWFPQMLVCGVFTSPPGLKSLLIFVESVVYSIDCMLLIEGEKC
jgi:hypothetical protein